MSYVTINVFRDIREDIAIKQKLIETKTIGRNENAHYHIWKIKMTEMRNRKTKK